jgi:hypothetical protein
METQTLTIPMDKLLKYQEQIYKRREYQNQSSKKYYNDNFKITDDLPDDEKERRIEKRNAYNARRRQLYANKKRLARIQEIINNISG